MSENHADSRSEELLAFVAERVAPLAKTFAQLPLMQLSVRTPQGKITLVKASAPASDATKPQTATKLSHAPRIQDGEPGRAYDTINAEAVGVFRAAPDAPEFGERLDADRVLGFVEALKLRNPVRAGAQCFFIAQAVEDGQAVEFGEVLFVVERGDTPPQAELTGEDLPAEGLADVDDEFDNSIDDLRDVRELGPLPPLNI